MKWVGDHYAGGSLDKRLSQSYCRSVKSAVFGSIAVTGGAFARLPGSFAVKSDGFRSAAPVGR